jgi:carboxylesterase type B
MKPVSIFLCLLFCRPIFSQQLIHKNNIVYGKASNWKNQTEDLKLDLIYPLKTTNLPLIVYLHGGAFLGGSKESDTRFCEQVAKKGFAVANVEYRQGYDQSPTVSIA